MRTVLCVLALISCALPSFAQRSSSRKSVEGQSSFYAELGGPGILFSANYDRRFKPSNLGWGIRAGLGFVTSDDYQGPYIGYKQRSVLTVPIQINHVFGKAHSPHTFEAGAGFTVLSKKIDVFNYYDNDREQLFGTFSFMYRRQPVNGGFSWRIGFTPLISSSYIQPSGGASVGYNF